MSNLITLKAALRNLRHIYQNVPTIKVPELYDDQKLKFELILNLYYQITQGVEAILFYHRKGRTVTMPIIARTIFENSINQSMLFVLDEVNGAKRFVNYKAIQDHKMHARYRSIIPEVADSLFTTQELQQATTTYHDFKKRGLSAREWFGKNLFECCEYLDKNHHTLINSESFFVLNYLQTYPFLSQTVHGMYGSFQNTRQIRGFWPFNKYIVFDNSLDHSVSVIYHTTTAYLTSLCVMGLAAKNLEFYYHYQPQLTRHFRILVNSLDKRNEVTTANNVRLMRYSALWRLIDFFAFRKRKKQSEQE